MFQPAPEGQDQSLQLHLTLWGFMLGRTWSSDVKAQGEAAVNHVSCFTHPSDCAVASELGFFFFPPISIQVDVAAARRSRAVLSWSVAALGCKPRPRSSCCRRSSEPVPAVGSPRCGDQRMIFQLESRAKQI